MDGCLIRALAAFLAGVICLMTAVAAAAERELRLPLEDGRLSVDALSAELMRELDLPAVRWPGAEIDFTGLRGSIVIEALNASLGKGFDLRIEDDALILRVDVERLPRNVAQAKSAARVFTSVVVPDVAADQNRLYGLYMPPSIDPNRPMVILVHGLDCTRAHWSSLAERLAAEGRQVAYFSYPSDQPLADSTMFLQRQFTALHEAYPSLSLNILAHSMGSLVVRAYLEGPDYAGGVDRLILIAPPNAGSKWASLRLALEIEEHWMLWKNEPSWHPAWMIMDGLGEAGRDLHPRSAFLDRLDQLPRREGVKYTIIAGERHPAAGVVADCLDAASSRIPAKAESWWGVVHCRQGLDALADRVRSIQTGGDGPVSIDSTRLAGVDDFVVLPGDHSTLYQGDPPVAWETIRDRLAR